MYNVRLGFCQEILRTNKNTAGTRMDSCPVLVRSTETEETELWDFLHPRPKIGARRCYWSVACNMIELLVSHPTCYSFFSRDLKLLRFFHPTFGTHQYHYHWFSPSSFLLQGCAMRRLNHKKGMVFSSHQMDQWGIRGVSTGCWSTVQNVWTKIATPGGDAFVVETAEEMMEMAKKRW